VRAATHRHSSPPKPTPTHACLLQGHYATTKTRDATSSLSTSSSCGASTSALSYGKGLDKLCGPTGGVRDQEVLCPRQKGSLSTDVPSSMPGRPDSFQLEVCGISHSEEGGGKAEVPLGCMPGRGG